MSCNKCNQNCNCNTQEICIQEDCSCPILDFPTSCIKYTGETLECTDIDTNQPFNEVLQQLDKFICDKFNFATTYFQLINIGEGVNIYKGDNLIGQKEIRSLTKTGDLIQITENSNEIDITIDEQELNNFIEENQKVYTVQNLPDGVGIYKESTVVGDTTTFNFRGLKSNTLIITEDEDDITIESNLIELQDFIVDTRFAGEDYEEKGTYAKPYKNLDNAIIAYIGSGTRLEPEFEGARILCIGGQSHSFTQNLSINNLTLEIEKGTIVAYNGADLYLTDFRTLQTSAGGYGSQDRNLIIKLIGEGELRTNNLLAYVVNSGHTISDPNRYHNNLTIENLTIRSYYKQEEFVDNITRSDLSEWISNTRPCSFYFGNIDEPMIVLEGQNTTNSMADNNLSGVVNITNATIISLSQQVIKNDSSHIRIINTDLRQGETIAGRTYITADDTALTGTVLQEDPLLSHTLPNYKEDLTLIKIEGSGVVLIFDSILNVNFNIIKQEAYYLIENDNSNLEIYNGRTESGFGGLNSEYFINIKSNNPRIVLEDVVLNKPLNPSGTFINTTLTPYDRITMKRCDIVSPLLDNIDLTRGNNISVINTFNNKITESLRIYNSRANAVAGGLESGNVFLNRKTITTGAFVTGEEYVIANVGDTDFTLIGASSNTVGEHFTATGAGGGTTGTAYYYKRDIVL